MARGDHLWHRRWSGGTNYGTVDGLGGPTMAAILGAGGPFMATNIATDGPGGPSVA